MANARNRAAGPQSSRPTLEIKEQAHRLPSINTNTSLLFHFEEQKGFALHGSQSPGCSFFSPQEFQPLPSGFITPPLDPARGASSLFRPPCFKPKRNRPKEGISAPRTLRLRLRVLRSSTGHIAQRPVPRTLQL